MAFLTRAEWPRGAVSCPSCSTGYRIPPWPTCYLCAHPEKRRGSFEYLMDDEEDADFGHAMGLDWGDD